MLETADLSQSHSDAQEELERLFLFSVSWALGGLMEPDDRLRYPKYPAAPAVSRPCRAWCVVL